MKPASEARAARRRWLAAVLLAGLVLRLGWGLSRPAGDAAIDLLPDQRGYLELARNLLSGDGLHYVDDRFGQAVYAMRTPGYPAFLALCGGSVRAARVVQALLDASTALAIYLLARRLVAPLRGAPELAFWRDPPLVACALVAFNPFLVYFSALLLTETLFTAMLAWAMLLLLTSRGILPGLLLLALAIHLRPSGIGLPVVMAAGAVLARRASCSGGLREQTRNDDTHPSALLPAGRGSRFATLAQMTAAAGIGLALTVAVLAPWAWRNHQVLGRWVWSTSNDGLTAYDGFRPGATGASDQSFVKRMPFLRDMGELARSDHLAREARRFARDNPRRVAELALAKAARTWSPVPLSDDFGRPLYRAVALTFAVPFDLLVIAGLFRGRMPRRVKLFLLLPALYFTAVHALSVGSLRYRVPAEPPLAVLAAAGAAGLLPMKAKGGG